ncbi:MAG: hypothetical protein CMJ83_10180 [Planctomycetes bacterium]|nr:hypothetical protein [Planctomycetota bacterium]
MHVDGYAFLMRTASATEAQLVCALLAAEDIPTITPGFTTDTSGWIAMVRALNDAFGDILVPEERLDEAREILEAARRSGDPESL